MAAIGSVLIMSEFYGQILSSHLLLSRTQWTNGKLMYTPRIAHRIIDVLFPFGTNIKSCKDFIPRSATLMPTLR